MVHRIAGRAGGSAQTAANTRKNAMILKVIDNAEALKATFHPNAPPLDKDQMAFCRKNTMEIQAAIGPEMFRAGQHAIKDLALMDKIRGTPQASGTSRAFGTPLNTNLINWQQNISIKRAMAKAAAKVEAKAKAKAKAARSSRPSRNKQVGIAARAAPRAAP